MRARSFLRRWSGDRSTISGSPPGSGTPRSGPRSGLDAVAVAAAKAGRRREVRDGAGKAMERGRKVRKAGLTMAASAGRGDWKTSEVGGDGGGTFNEGTISCVYLKRKRDGKDGDPFLPTCVELLEIS